MSSWDILIATIPQRHEKLCELLVSLDRQWQPGLLVRVFRDNLELPVGVKRQRLLESSLADYTSFADDDDEVALDYVSRIFEALRSSPDYVGFTVKLTCGGLPFTTARHSLRNPGWVSAGEMLLRDISHLNPIRRELALQARFDTGGGGYGEDGRWADELRGLGTVRTEEFIGPDWAYHYRMEGLGDWSGRSLEPVQPDEIKPLPSYPWLVTI